MLFGGPSRHEEPSTRSWARGLRGSPLIVLGRGRQDYATGALRAGMPAAAIHDGGTTPQQAVAALRGLFRTGDVVLTKGRKGQGLERVLLLQGVPVGCELSLCDFAESCATCPMLATGWEGRPIVLQRGLEP